MRATLQLIDVARWREVTRDRRRFRVPVASEEDRQRLKAIFGKDISTEEAVEAIVDDVAARGEAALLEWTRRIDGVEPDRGAGDAEAAWNSTPPELQAALRIEAERIRAFHEQQVDTARRGSSSIHLRPTPLARVGCYVPGGRAAYPSTVFMTALPALVAGVPSVVIATPPTPSGTAHPAVLAAAHLIGVDEVLPFGGAQAIAALAYGTETIEAVDKIVGPGNVFVTLAKRRVFGSVGIDGLAGPSEVLIVASDDAVPRWIAHDLVSQLEHDPLAWAACLTDSGRIAKAVVEEFEDVASSAARSGIIASASARHGYAVHCRDMAEALECVNDFAPEHLELQGTEAEALCDRVRTAGAIFVGGDTPVPMGDYIAGPNHTLPTGGAARFSGGLSVMDFMRWSSVTRLSRDQLKALGPIACTLAEAEGLTGHALSIRARLEGDTGNGEAPKTAGVESVAGTVRE